MEISENEYLDSTGMKTQVLKRIPKRCSYKWTIRNFKTHGLKKKNNYDLFPKVIISPLFRSSDAQDELQVSSGGCGSCFVSIYLIRQIDNDISESDVEFFILDNAMQPRNRTRGILFNEKNFMRQEFVKMTDLCDTKQNLLNGDELTVVCTFIKYVSSETFRSDIENEFQKCKDKVSLSNDFQKLLEKKLLTDVTLVANDKKLHAHRLILVARSPIFAAMLRNDMENKVKSEIIISDFSTDIVSKMLQFMYTEIVTNIEDHFQDLLRLANKYDIEGLRLICGEFMLNKLTIENAIEFFMLAESQNCNALRPKLLKFLMNNASMVIKSSEFESRKKDLPPFLVDLLKAAKG